MYMEVVIIHKTQHHNVASRSCIIAISGFLNVRSYFNHHQKLKEKRDTHRKGRVLSVLFIALEISIAGGLLKVRRRRHSPKGLVF